MNGLNELRDRVHALAREKGWWDGGNQNIGEKLMLVVTELAEAMEEIRTMPGRLAVYSLAGSTKPEGFAIELADALIRILDLCGALDIDIDNAVTMKHAFNKTRPYRHGGKSA